MRLSLYTATVRDMAPIERRVRRWLQISCLEEIGVQTVNFADIIIVIKNGLRKEEKKLCWKL